MYLYYTTFVVEDSENNWWADWMKRHYLPTFFDIVPNASNEIYKVDGQPQNSGATTYSCQWRCHTIQELGLIQKYDKALSAKLMEQKGEKCLTFSTMMKGVEL